MAIMNQDDYFRSIGGTYDYDQENKTGGWTFENLPPELQNLFADAASQDREFGPEAYQNYLTNQYSSDFGVAPKSKFSGGLDNLAIIQSTDETLTHWMNNTNPDFPTMPMTEQRKQEVLQQIAQNPGQDWREFLTPQERQVADTWQTYESQNRGHDPMAKALMAAMISGFAALAGPSMLAGLGGEAAAAGAAGSGLTEAQIANIIAAEGGYSALPSIGMGGTAAGAGGLGGALEAGLASSEGFVPGSFEIGASGYGGTAGAGLDAATAEWLAASGAGAGAGVGTDTAAQQAIDGSAQTIYDANPAIPGTASGVTPTATTAATAGSALSRILGGNATDADWLSVIGTAGATGLGMIGANQQADAYSDVSNKWMQQGQWARDALKGTFDPGYSMASQPDFMNALNIGADAAARATSAKVGNPVDNPGAYAEMQKYISGSLALPQLNTTRNLLMNAGNVGTGAAGTADMSAAGQTGGMYNALGYGLGQLTQPANPYTGALQKLLLNSGTSF